jgi:hypothetical protein
MRMLKGVNWISVIVAFVALEALGYVWYGMVFQHCWVAEMTAVGLKPDMSQAAQTRSISEGAGLILVQILGLSWLFRRSGAAGLSGAIGAALTAYVVFALTTQAMEYVYMGFTPKLMAINCGQLLASYLVAGAILGGLKIGRPAEAAA